MLNNKNKKVILKRLVNENKDYQDSVKYFEFMLNNFKGNLIEQIGFIKGEINVVKSDYQRLESDYIEYHDSGIYDIEKVLIAIRVNARYQNYLEFMLKDLEKTYESIGS